MYLGSVGLNLKTPFMNLWTSECLPKEIPLCGSIIKDNADLAVFEEE